MNSHQIVFPLSVVLLASSMSGQSLPVTYQPVDVASSSAQDTSEAPEHPVSKREIRAMIANAKTAQDHQAIADYFAQQADLFEKKSSEHEARCAPIAEHPMNYKTKYPSAYDGCHFWVQHYAAQSTKARNTAELHRQLAITLVDGTQ